MTKPAKPKRKFSFRRAGFISIAVVSSFILTYLFSDHLSNKPDVLGIVATIFSIFAGVLIAVISILGDPSMLLDHSWRHSYLSAQETQRNLHRQTDIFILYVILLVAVFVFMICDQEGRVFVYVQRCVFFLISLAFFGSLSLPFTLKEIQRARLDRVINQMRNRN